MNTTCPHCQVGINIDPPTLAALAGHGHFNCPACQRAVAVPTRSRALASAQRGINRNLLILGSITLLVLGGIGFHLASQKSGDTNTTVQNIRNEIINNDYFQNLIATGVTTMDELEAIADIRPYQDGFIGISESKLEWIEAKALAGRTGAVVIEVGSDDELESWLVRTFATHSLAWVSTRGDIGLMTDAGAIALKKANGRHQVLLHWHLSRPAPETVLPDPAIVDQDTDEMVAEEDLDAIGVARVDDVVLAAAPDGFALIPAGSFTMGGTSGDADRNIPPAVTVYVSEFYMATHEVTNDLWNEVSAWGRDYGYTDIRVRVGSNAEHPASGVSWWDAVKWCNARSEMDGLTPVYTNAGNVMRTGTTEPVVNWNANGYRLPTEAEWEKAARGGVPGQRFPWGDESNHSHANYGGGFYLNYDTNPYSTWTRHPTYDDGDFGTSPVGSFAPNGYGLHDMAGNVSEWCWDWFGSPYTEGASDPRGPASGTRRVKRGGDYINSAAPCRSAYRSSSVPDQQSPGFRTARSMAL